MKRLWLTSMSRDEKAVKDILANLKKYGLEASGHFWKDNLEKMEWIAPREEIISNDTVIWAIFLTGDCLNRDSTRYGLSLLTITVRAKRGLDFPIIFLKDKNFLMPEEIPTPLRGIDVLDITSPTVFAKLVAIFHRSPAKNTSELDYKVDVYGNQQIGQWFEVGPGTNFQWEGAIFGVSNGEITFHAVGKKGRLPERAILNYPIKDMKLALGEEEFISWAVQNPIGPDDSYFVQVKGYPSSIVFGPFSQNDETELFYLQLK